MQAVLLNQIQAFVFTYIFIQINIQKSSKVEREKRSYLQMAEGIKRAAAPEQLTAA